MRIVVVPPVPALLPSYASLDDPVAPLRAACREAVAWLVADGPVEVRAVDDLGRRVGDVLLGDAARGAGGLLVVANGSACRSEKAPGHLDERAHDFDAAVLAALAAGDADALGGIDLALADDLLATGAPVLRGLAGTTVLEASVDHADDPYGVAYWVVRWECA